jgi:hypothetical protein
MPESKHASTIAAEAGARLHARLERAVCRGSRGYRVNRSQNLPIWWPSQIVGRKPPGFF